MSDNLPPTRMTTRSEFKLLTEHGPTQSDWPECHEWVDIGGVTHRLDAIGRRNGDTHLWRSLVCNEPECPGRALYRADVVERLAEEWDESRGAGRHKPGGYNPPAGQADGDQT